MMFHYFVSGFDVWVTEEDLHLAIKRFFKESRADRGTVYRVPCAADRPYKIEWYQPVVEGTVMIDQCFRSNTAREKAAKYGDLDRLQEVHDDLASPGTYGPKVEA